MSRMTKRALAAVGAGVLTATVAFAAPATAAKGGGNIACPTGTTMLKVDRAPVLDDVFTDGTLTVTVTSVKTKLNDSDEVYGFRASFAGATLRQVIVKGGPTAITYRDPSRLFSTKKAGTPSGTHYEISNVKFCYVP